MLARVLLICFIGVTCGLPSGQAKAQSSRVAIAPPVEKSHKQPQAAKTKRVIDRFIQKRIQEAGERSATLSSDEEFLRRVYLDVVGVIPSLTEAKQFLKDTSKNKRSILINRLLENERYSLHWSVMWGDLLRERYRAIGVQGTIAGSYRNWIRERLKSNQPYDQFVKELVTARGTAETNAATNFYLRDPNQRSETVNIISSVFMGTRMQCAQCHDHPFDRWEQKDFHGLMAFLSPRTVVIPDAASTLRRVEESPRFDPALKTKLTPLLATARIKMQEAKQQKYMKPKKRNKSGAKKAKGNKKAKRKGKGRKKLIAKRKKVAQPRLLTPLESLRLQYKAIRTILYDPKIKLSPSEQQKLRGAINQLRLSHVLERERGLYHMPGDGSVVKGKKVLGEMIQPAFAWDRTKHIPTKGSRAEALADLVTGSRRFAEVHVNRLWHRLLGRGLVHPVDDFRDKNPASHPELLAALADELIRSTFDTKHVLRLILNSHTYQQSTRSASAEEAPSHLFASQKLRKMTAEQMVDSMITATGFGKSGFNSIEKPLQFRYLMNLDMHKEFDPSLIKTWSADLPTPARGGTFLHSFHQPKREQITCERPVQGSITQALELLNGAGTNVLVRNRPGSLTRSLWKARKSADQIGEIVFLSYLSRYPSAQEKIMVQRIFKGKKWKEFVQQLEDLQWVVLNMHEFRFVQ